MTSPRNQTRNQTVLPLQNSDLLEAIRALLESEGSAALLAHDDQPLELPERLRAVLQYVVEAMHRGQAITISPVRHQLTTQEGCGSVGCQPPHADQIAGGWRDFVRDAGPSPSRQTVRLADVSIRTSRGAASNPARPHAGVAGRGSLLRDAGELRGSPQRSACQACLIRMCPS
jgi:hypothetical protein